MASDEVDTVRQAKVENTPISDLYDKLESGPKECRQNDPASLPVNFGEKPHYHSFSLS